jgi:ubiquinol-cytochrome c reductase cytochrome c subunit
MKIFLLGLAAACGLWAQNQDSGKRLFEVKACYQCHGWLGQGGLAGPRLAQTKMNLTAFRAIVRNPPPGGMPQFRTAVLSDQELADIFAYIQTFPAPQPAANIPLLKN